MNLGNKLDFYGLDLQKKNFASNHEILGSQSILKMNWDQD